MSDNQIIIRKANIDDAKSISDITDFWVLKGKTNDKDKGYLREKGVYTEIEVSTLIEKSYVIVAADKNTIASFYLINNVYHQDLILERKNLIEKKIANEELPFGKYAYSLLAATDERYLGLGLNTKTLNLLKELSQLEYDYFIGVMGYDNIATHKSSLKMGWKHFGDIGNGLLAVIGTTEENNNKLKP